MPSLSLILSTVAGVWASEYIPRGTRFGPMQGEIYPRNAVPATVDRKYFWRVYDKQTNDVSFFVDGKDVRRANWMRYVLPAYINAAQVQRERGSQTCQCCGSGIRCLFDPLNQDGSGMKKPDHISECLTTIFLG
jgi:hypothetical protein